MDAPNSDSDFIIQSRNDISEFSMSDEDGFMAMPFKIRVVKVASLTASFVFHVDDSSINIGSFTVLGNLAAVPDYCAFI